MYKIGQIVSINGQEAEIKCLPEEQANCKSCGLRCNSRNPLLKARFDLGNVEEAKPGDIVRVYLPDHSVFYLSSVVFLIPTVFLVSGIVIGSVYGGNSNINLLLGGVIGFIIGVSLVYILRKSVTFEAKIIELRKGGLENG